MALNHDPESSLLRIALQSLPVNPNAEIYLATGCFMGYGIFDQGIAPLKDALTKFGDYI